MMELTEQAQAALVDAKRLAKRLGDNYIGTEHLLVALSDRKTSGCQGFSRVLAYQKRI